MPRLAGVIDAGGGAFVQLRDAAGDFVGEVRADHDGYFAFYAIPGHWRLVCLMPGERREREVDMGDTDLEIVVPA